MSVKHPELRFLVLEIRVGVN